MSNRTIADRYELVDRLGAGGGGVVWRACDLRLDRTVAVKEIDLSRGLPADERERVQARALREARAAARIEHTNVVSVYDVRSDDDAIHIVMEHVDAPSLQDVVADTGPLEPEQAAALGVEVLDALQAAHRAGIVHRDVKPSNVLVAPDGAQVTDFGIAAVTGDTALTMSGQALGTPDYVSPEQVHGDEVSPATDLWSLGATLYYAVEGRPPFRRERSVSTVHAVVHDEPRPMARASPLAPMVQDLLAKDPADRPDPTTARSRLLEVVDRVGQDDTTASIPPVAVDTTRELDRPDPPVPPSSAAEPRPRRRGVTAVVAVVAMAALVGVAAVLANLPTGGAEEASPPGVPAPTGPGATNPAHPSTPPATDAPQTSGPTTSAPPADTTSPAEPPDTAPVPQGWQTYEGPTYTVAHPPQWSTRDVSAPNNIDLVAPNDGHGYLRVAHTDEPADDVVRDSERIEAAFREDHANYQRIRLEPTEYRDTDAAIWEYTFTADGQPYHAIHLNLSTGDRGYALNHVVPEASWSAAADRFDQFTESFTYP